MTPTRRFWTVAAITAVITAALALTYPKQPDREFRELVEHVATGSEQPYPRAMLEYFGLPADGDFSRFHELRATVDGGRSRSFLVRHRDDATDVFLVATFPNYADFYLATRDGELLKACRIDVAPRPLQDAEAGFAEEWAFWRHAWREMKTAK